MNVNIQQSNDPGATWATGASTTTAGAQGGPSTATFNGKSDVSLADQTITQGSLIPKDAGKPILTPSDAPVDLSFFTNYGDSQALQGQLSQIYSNLTASQAEKTEKAWQEYKGVSVEDQDIQKLANKLGLPPGKVLKDIQSQYSFFLRKALQEGASSGDQELLLFAHYFPDSAPSLNPNLKAFLKKCEEQTEEKIQKELGMPQGWKPPGGDKKAMEEEISSFFDQSFESLLLEYGQAHNLSDNSMAQLRALHYGLSDVPDQANLRSTFQLIEKKAAEQTAAKFNALPSWHPASNSSSFNQILVGAFRLEFDEKLKNAQPKLSSEDMAEIRKFLQNPDAPVPERIKKLAQEFMMSALSSIKGRFGLPNSWVPPAEISFNEPVGMSIQTFGKTAHAQAKEVLSAFTMQVNQLPPSPDKSVYMNFLAIIGKALDEIQKMVYELNGTDSKVAKLYSVVKMDSQLAQLERQKERLEEMKDKQSKMGDLGPLNKIMTWVTNLTILALGAGTAPVTFGLSLAIASAYVVSNTVAEEKGQRSLALQAFDAIREETGAGGSIPIDLVLITFFSVGNPMLFLQMFSQDAQVAQNFVAVCGGDKMAQDITAMAVNAIAQIGLMIAMTVATGGAGTPVMIAELVEKIFEVSAKTAMMIVKIMFAAYEIVMASIQVAQKAVSINNHILQGQIELLKGRQEADIQEVQAFIQLLKKVIQKLLEAMQGNTEWLLDISKAQSQKYYDASKIITSITAA